MGGEEEAAPRAAETPVGSPEMLGEIKRDPRYRHGAISMMGAGLNLAPDATTARASSAVAAWARYVKMYSTHYPMTFDPLVS